MKMKLVLLCVAAVTVISCYKGAESPRGFSLPKGDLDNGKAVFVKYNCMACHTIEGMNKSDTKLELERAVHLGGESAKITTYAELVTAIINPSHRISKGFKGLTTNPDGSSKMPSHNDVMTVTELIDLVSFLQSKYKVKPITYTHYGQYRTPH
jgi:L-cysteine S-thiosulfotransferase